MESAGATFGMLLITKGGDLAVQKGSPAGGRASLVLR